MKDFHAEPIKKGLDRNQTVSCPGKPGLESIIHLEIKCAALGFSTKGPGRAGQGEGQLQRQVRGKKQEAVMVSKTVCFQRREPSRKAI